MQNTNNDLIFVTKTFEKKVKDLIKDEKTKDIAKKLEELKNQLKLISPDHIQQKRLPKPIKTILPSFIQNLLETPIEKVLETIKENYETVEEAVKDIERYLYLARDNLLLDIEELKIFRQKLEEFIRKIDQKTAETEKQLEELNKKKRELEEKALSGKDITMEILEIDSQLFETSQELQDLQTIKQAIGQGIISIHQLIDTNKALITAIERTIKVSKITINIGIILRQAISNQSKAIKAVQDTQNFASNLLLENANTLKSQTKDIQKLYTQPVLALDKVKEAYKTLISAIEEFENIKKQGHKIAMENIKTLEEMNKELETKLKTL
ncbi:toxic anion resistance protein [Persephonella sp. KM09-Lau-8]|uniref:toxic anion resistance protein n=1 Tax=Persephonella sp. KM09-Lau-8 TaxID=1158345 RepID=UPI000496D1C1|nr:toxic anion resistance protein [Persephonella sp. KM09-Lau-8]